MQKYIRITTILETSDHDGYCSGSECYYESERKIFVFVTPTQYEKSSIGFIEDYDEKDIIHLLPKPQINMSGSCYCINSIEADERDLCIHDYRYNIISVEIIQ